MSEERLRYSAVVIATYDPEQDHRYVPDHIPRRKKYHKQMGTVEEISDSHGLCYKIEFGDKGTAWYEPSELVVVRG